MASAAHALLREFGESLRSSNWLGSGTFRDFLASFSDAGFAVAPVPIPGYLYDPQRHELPTDSVPLAGVPPEIVALIGRVGQVTDAPRLSPRQYRVAFETIAAVVNASGYHLIGTGKVARDRCVEQGEQISRQSITWILGQLSSQGAFTTGQPVLPERLAAAFRMAVVNLLLAADIALDDAERALLDDWLLGGQSAHRDNPRPNDRGGVDPRGRCAPPREWPAVVRALVSIGTNSTRLLVLDGALRVASESRGTRIGTGIGVSGKIDPAAWERTLAAVDDYLRVARARGTTQIDAIATSGLRRASDGEAFGAEVAARVGIAPRVLSGAEEATYSFLGATSVPTGSARSRCSTSAAAARSWRSTRPPAPAPAAWWSGRSRSRSARCAWPSAIRRCSARARWATTSRRALDELPAPTSPRCSARTARCAASTS